MKTLVLWVWAFGFAILKHIAEKYPKDTIFAYEKDSFTSWYLRNFRKHPYLYEWIKLPRNIVYIEDLEKTLPNIDLLIISIPCQFIRDFLSEIKLFLKPWVTILNLSKWINNKTLNTVWDDLAEVLKWISYNYACLSWWMIASDIIKWDTIWWSIWVESEWLWLILKNYLETPIFKLNLYTKRVKNTELAWALKNIFAIFTWYYEWQWHWSSSIWCFFCDYFTEYKKLFTLLWWNDDIWFDKYAVWWDLIATCFWNSRNRYFWKLIWKWKTLNETLKIMKNEKKTTEWYETLKWLYELVKDNPEFPMTKHYWEKILFNN